MEDSTEDLYENAPCGYLSTLLDGQIAKINTTLLTWLGHTREELVGRRRFADLLTVGGRLYHETHFAPLLRMQGKLGGVALEMRAADGTRLPVLVTSTLKTGPDGEPLLIRTTVFDARDRRAYERELLRARQEADRDRERLQRLVSTLQRSLLPPALPAVPGMEVAAHYHTASADQLGGDFYDLFRLADDRWAFFLGDVCGKGAEAATMTSLVRYTLRAAAHGDPDPVSVLESLNSALLAEYSSEYPFYCTVLFGLLTVVAPGTAEITLTGGGHPPALAIRGSGAVEPVHPDGGLLVGLMSDPYFATSTVRLDPGDGLLLYTDGLTEARMPDGDLFGDDRLEELAATLSGASAPEMTEAVARVLTGFGSGLTDDTAVLALTVPAPSSSPPPKVSS
ncbi:PP2C family protein-serine/threonine phosphatase [Streptosporangium lutulentum]|uniref:Sigma-B regulation protein RsbU (Phosphoserine phosphatase) n=1 Tax=Streptosporangium lutulentum TaxID=1461250 RepID=A0ABT9Q7L8_9ACTN|nr:SpoIIE family protein phosphatase [Streptosporangium lutulentum]MDP9842405.1 sigma-B regulation protein RsbU (phosphoserine phosphatase) [Streptosporangium lutulentum]